MPLRHRSLSTKGFLVALSVLVLSSCTTLDVAKIKQAERVAVPIITVDQYIDLSDVGGRGTLVQRLVQDDKFDLSPMVEKLHGKVYGEYADRIPATIMSEEEVIQTDRYQNFSLVDDDNDDTFERLQAILVPEGYKKYDLGQGALIADQQKQMFKAVPDRADALLFASASYALEKDNPFWYWFLPFSPPDRGYAEATVRLEMIDRTGDTILRISESAQSDEYVTLVGGLTLDADKIQPMCVKATEKAFAKVDQVTREELSEK